MRKDLTPEELGAIVGPLADAHNITSVSLFGSRATGRHTRGSDYDLLIETNADFSFADYCDFIEALESALGTHVVDSAPSMRFFETLFDGSSEARVFDVFR